MVNNNALRLITCTLRASGVFKNNITMITDLRNTTPNKKDHKFFKQFRAINNILNSDKVAAVSGDNGAIDIYRDDNGKIHVRVHRWLKTIHESVHDTLLLAKPTVTKWMKDIQ